MPNPLLDSTRDYRLPDFQSVTPEHVLPALSQLLQQYRDGIDQWGAADASIGWNMVEQEVEWSDAISRAWSVVSHLHLVQDSKALREVYNEGLDEMTRHENWRQHHQGIYRAYKALQESENFAGMSSHQQRIVNLEIRDFELEGVGLPESDKAEYEKLTMRLGKLGAEFGQNLLDARNSWTLEVDSSDRLQGLPQSEVGLLAELAKERGKAGWLVDLSYPSYLAIMQHADDRDIRYQVYRAFATCASDQGPDAGQWDNTPVIDEILKVRHQLARLLGFDHYVDYALSRRMADSPQSIMSFLKSLQQKAVPAARKQFDKLEKFAGSQGAELPLEPWDVTYWSERFRQVELDLSDEALKPYFALDQMIDAVFFTAKSVFEIEMIEDESITTWHKDVRYFWLQDSSGEKMGGLFVDLFARRKKRDGAWMDSCLSRRRLETGEQLPVAYLVCNFAPPVDGRPCLMTHRDVETLFHEFGHCLHHLLTVIEWPQINGINNVEWDAVELPSQLLENWCWEDEIIMRYAVHYKTGEVIPPELKERLLRSRRFQKAMVLVRQLEFALTDMRLHLEYNPENPVNPLAVLNEVRNEVAIFAAPEWNRFLNGFSHIFGGGYSAGYYSYLWAEQLAADAWGRFLQEGAFNADTGHQLRSEILSVGSSRPAMDSFIGFLGRPPDPQPLLESYGL